MGGISQKFIGDPVKSTIKGTVVRLSILDKL
jgi:hypothetical protein